MIPYRWIIFTFVYFSFTTQYISYLSWNPFIALAEDLFGFQMIQCSVIVSAIAIGRIVSQIPGGIIADKFPPKVVLISSLTILGLITFLVSLKASFAIMLVGQFLISVSGVVIWPLAVKIVVDYFPQTRRDFMSGLLNTSATIAVMGTNFFIPYLVFNYSWHAAFQIISFLCFLNVIILLIFMKRNGEKSETSAPTKKRFNFNDVGLLLKNKGFLLTLAIFSGALYSAWGTNTWIPTYLVYKAQLPATTVGSMMAAFGIAGGIAMPVVGLITKGDPKKKYRFLFCDYFALAALLITISFTTSETLLWILMPCLGIATFGHMGPMNMIIADFIDSKIMGTATAVALFTWQLTVVAQSLVIGKVLDFATSPSYYSSVAVILSFGACFACIAILFIQKKLKNKELVIQ